MRARSLYQLKRNFVRQTFVSEIAKYDRIPRSEKGRLCTQQTKTCMPHISAAAATTHNTRIAKNTRSVRHKMHPALCRERDSAMPSDRSLFLLRASRLVMTLTTTLTTRLERLTSACTRRAVLGRAVLGRAVLSDALCYTRRQPATLPPPSPRCREREPPLPQPPFPRPAPLPLRPRSPSE